MRHGYVAHMPVPLGACLLYAGAVLCSHLDAASTTAVAAHVLGCGLGPVLAATTWQRVHPPGTDSPAYLLVRACVWRLTNTRQTATRGRMTAAVLLLDPFRGDDGLACVLRRCIHSLQCRPMLGTSWQRSCCWMKCARAALRRVPRLTGAGSLSAGRAGDAAIAERRAGTHHARGPPPAPAGHHPAPLVQHGVCALLLLLLIARAGVAAHRR